MCEVDSRATVWEYAHERAKDVCLTAANQLSEQDSKFSGGWLFKSRRLAEVLGGKGCKWEATWTLLLSAVTQPSVLNWIKDTGLWDLKVLPVIAIKSHPIPRATLLCWHFVFAKFRGTCDFATGDDTVSVLGFVCHPNNLIPDTHTSSFNVHDHQRQHLISSSLIIISIIITNCPHSHYHQYTHSTTTTNIPGKFATPFIALVHRLELI